MVEKKLFLLDAYALIFRSYYAFIRTPRITSYGLNTSAIFGFTNTLLDVLQNQKPSHIAVVFDHKSETLRAQEHSFYKANRDETPEDIKKSEPFIRRIVEAFRIPVLEAEGYEADDVIGTLAHQAEADGFHTFMMTPDKDFGQLVTEKTKMYRPGRQGNTAEIWGPAEVCEKFGLNHVKQVIDYLGLMGDAVDNIPGVPGVGPKTASALLQQYGSMENLYKHTHELKGKLKDRIEENKEQAFISRKLATILTDAPVDFDVSTLILEEPDKEKIKEIFNELEFRTLFRRVLGEEPQQIASGGQQSLFPDLRTQSSSSQIDPNLPSAPIAGLLTISEVPHHYELVSDETDRNELLKKLLGQKCVAFDTETTSLETLDAEILGCAFSFEAHTGFYMPLPRGRAEARQILDSFRPFFEHEGIEKVLQNAKYDISVLWNYDIELKGPLFDTMLAHYLAEPDQRHNMDYLSEKYLDYRPVSITELIGKKGKNQLGFETVELEKAKEYAAEDADITFRLKPVLEELLREYEIRHILDDIEIPLVPVLARMERSGVRIDAQFLKEYSKELQAEALQLEQTIYADAGEKFNIASPKQLGDLLFGKLRLDPNAKKTRTGQYRTDEETLLNIADRHPLPNHVLEYRQIQKLKSTYVDALPDLIHPVTGRVHTSFAQAVAATGRLSSNNPNLQNIPIRTEKGREIRRAFIPGSEELTLMAIDYSQIELRIIASVSEDEGMMEAFNQNLDIHTATAAKVFMVPLDQVDKEMRRRAKTVNFGIIYGISAFGLSQRIGISRNEARDIIEAYFKQFPGIQRYMDETIKFCRDHGYVQTILGRKRFIRDINSLNRTVVGFAERNAINAPIQGSAADMIKLAMIRVDQAIREMGLKSKMILQVHDELLFDAHLDEVETLRELVVPLMEKALPLRVPVVVEVGVGANWLEAH